MQRTRRHGRRLGMLLGLAVACGSVVLCGCRASGPPRPPEPLPGVNAVLAEGLPFEGQVAEGDTRVVVRCRGGDIFWKKTRGDWEYQWLVVRFDVLEVERGRWPEPTVSFICWIKWPTPESGIMVSVETHYLKGERLVFDLETSQQPALIVGQRAMPDPVKGPIMP